MAQRLKHGVAPYCLAAYGTNNKFSHIDCGRRLDFISEALTNAGDGDTNTRILKASKIRSG